MKRKKADLHVHTNFTDGFASPEEMVQAAEEKGIDFLAITDHNLIQPAQIAAEFARKKRLRVKKSSEKRFIPGKGR